MHNVLTERVSTSTTTENQLYTSTLPTFTTLPTTKIVTTNFYLPETLHPTQPSVDHEQDNTESTTETIINTAVAEKLAIETTILPMVESTTHFSEIIHRPTDPFLLLNTSITIGETNNTANWNNGSNHSGSFTSSVPTTTNLTISTFPVVAARKRKMWSTYDKIGLYACRITKLLKKNNFFHDRDLSTINNIISRKFDYVLCDSLLSGKPIFYAKNI
ncbi:hepatitis A virus cellular receptor 1-like [Folsomia candida]|uniref:hepatitis A virus cellular receptor 1-like n=1 Tax=Folsomia candida TaxID=158441 RepID=UPI0016050BC0|nr:hepatitis A virus cellular receptor 1-like [Folsomia candida]